MSEGQDHERPRKVEFTLADFRKMLGQTRKRGSLNEIMGLIPGMVDLTELMADVDIEKDMARLGGIVDSMTSAERALPSKLIDQSRRRRIASGAGVEPHEVKELVKQFDGMASIMNDLRKLRDD